jgi:alpha,alpha-trehalase
MAGEPERGREPVERAAARSTDVGLLAGMADPRTGQPLGNLPQALSHVGLVAAALAIGEAERGKVRAGRALARPRG